VGRLTTHNLQPANSYKCTQLTPKTASVVPPEDGRLTPETCRGLRHNKVIVKVNVYVVGYVIVIHNDNRSTKYQILTEQVPYRRNNEDFQ
jgi:hypothetical protein